jgi:two-component system, NtrC family, sensor histidine kinase HydH
MRAASESCMFDVMAWYTLFSAVACVGHLAFALVLWLRRDRGNLALPLSLLFLDTFLWTFAELAFVLTGAVEWHWVDHAFSSWLPVLTVQVIAVFVGRARPLRPALRVLYVAAALIAATSATELWWRLLLAYGVGCMGFCGALLVQHRRRTTDATERARTSALLLAVLFGTVLSSSDLWVDHFPGVPRLSDVGMLVILSLVAVCVLRLRLLEREVPGLLVVYSLLGGTLLLAAGLVLVQWLPSRGAILALLLAATLAVGLAAAREAARARAAATERLQKLVALGRFSEQLAHDLRNPLAALKGAVQYLLVEREQGRSLDEQGPFLSLMLEQVERTSRVIDAYQRIANVEPIKVSTSLNELVASVLGMQRFASTPEISVRSRLEPGLPACALDTELLQTTLENLLRNAFEAMPGGGAITVETRAKPGHQSTPGVLLSVTDEGQGMDARILERATEQFFTTKATGSGLGLNFVERVAHAHDGYLDLASELGRGTTVRLWMPLHPPC